MSFLRHKEINKSEEDAIIGPAPSLMVLMSFQLAIPWPVALRAGLCFANRTSFCSFRH
jgi:hypothetical protein